MTRYLAAFLLAPLTLGACASPYRDRPISSAPTQRAQTSHIDDYFTFKWTEIGRPVEQWANYGR
jgi:hypothetical protein